MGKKKQITARRTVGVSTLVSFSDIVINFIAAAITGSVVLIAQALQGFADLTTTLMLLIGVNRSKHQPTQRHPLGYGRELFFWVLLASLFTFLITGGVALYQ
ncbi:MAG: cation transporter, partial [Candidatus Saccharimonadales bacterium]|nr:cation transporter [Candidatus Saccharimonadales bacterium]